MAIIGTFNGASIVALPTSPAIKQVEVVVNDSVAISRSPFTGVTQTQAWPGADWYDMTITMPSMTPGDAAVWLAFLMQLRGMTNCFYLGDPLASSPRGSAGGQPLVSGINAVASTTLTTRGWRPNQSRALEPGDQIQIGVRLHRVLDVVKVDANGNATLSIWPSLRESPADGDKITLNNPKGLFRLAENKRSRTSSETRLSAMTIKCTEAR